MSMDYGCIFCVAGRERNVVTFLEKESIQAISPVKHRYRRHDGVKDLEKVTLFPGYVFFAVDPELMDLDFLRIRTHSDVLRILYSGDEKRWQLSGTDRDFVKELFSFGAEIGFSKGYYIEKTIHFTQGFLQNHEKDIVAVNHRAQTAQIKIRIGEIAFTLWLGFELTDRTGES